MRQAIWAGLTVALVAGGPLAGFAQDAVIRIEAKRSAEAAADAAAIWGQTFGDVVVFPLPRGWFAIGLGPQSPDEAAARLTQLKATQAIPADSFVAVPEGVTLRPAGSTALPPAEDPDDTGAQEADQRPAARAGNPSLAAEALAQQGGGDLLGDGGIVIDPDLLQADMVDNDLSADSHPVAIEVPKSVIRDDAPSDDAPAETAQQSVEAPLSEPPATDAATPGSHIRLQTISGRADADAALAKWRETFAEASLWQVSGDRFSVALGPLNDATAAAWLTAFREGDAVPRDAFISATADLGEMLDQGAALDLPAPGPTEQMPPLEDVQRALRWAGHYDGDIDGKAGPRTRAAIAVEVANLRLSPDAGTAMRLLIERRADWRDQMGLKELRDDYTGLALTAPMDVLTFNRHERALSIYGPRDDSGVALILFSQPGGQQELLDMSGLITALGWVPQPTRRITPGHVLLEGANADHIGHAEGWVRNGRAEGFVLIWPAMDTVNQTRIAAELTDSLSRFADAENDQQADQPVQP